MNCPIQVTPVASCWLPGKKPSPNSLKAPAHRLHQPSSSVLPKQVSAFAWGLWPPLHPWLPLAYLFLMNVNSQTGSTEDWGTSPYPRSRHGKVEASPRQCTVKNPLKGWVLLVASEDVFCSCVLELPTENPLVHPFGESAPIRNPQSASDSKITCIILNDELGTMRITSSKGVWELEWGLRGFLKEFWGLQF